MDKNKRIRNNYSVRRKMDTKEKILLGMLDLIQEVGLEKASMGKLSQKIHASPGNIYFYFSLQKG